MPQHIPSGYTAYSLGFTNGLSSRTSFVTGGLDTSGVDMEDAGVRTGIATGLRSLFAPRIDSNVTVGPVHFRTGPYPPEALVFVDLATTAGGRAMSSPPSSVALLVHLSTGRGGRRGRGRWFLPWAVDETEVNEVGAVSGAEQVSWNADFAGGIAAIATAGTPLVLLHSYNPEPDPPAWPTGQDPDVGGAPNAITSATVSPLIGTQRRRLGR